MLVYFPNDSIKGSFSRKLGNNFVNQKKIKVALT